ncbi:hypothetical protein [Xanthomonas vasicola]|uniref:hypothetical protein n=1 Tax=Xanthomonas vasicola TaxID=56459 RepID=UPI001645C1FF|nr:hypothetical protein [Xanthomonas vasicola]
MATSALTISACARLSPCSSVMTVPVPMPMRSSAPPRRSPSTTAERSIERDIDWK